MNTKLHTHIICKKKKECTTKLCLNQKYIISLKKNSADEYKPV